MMELRYFKDEIGPEDVELLLNEPGTFKTESFRHHADLGAVRDVLDPLLAGGGMKVAGWDAELAPAFHAALQNCDRRLLLDMRLWHWLALGPFSDFVLRRWCGVNNLAEREQKPLTAAERDHFLGRPTLNGFNRNAIARLYWVAEALHTPQDGYSLVTAVMGSQDLLTGIFERFFSLYPPAARACVRVLKDVKEEDERRARLKNLNLVASTIALESLGQDDIEKLVTTAA
jgi:hypothetical protein